MLQINLSHTSVTDVGLLSLASMSCLQSMTILHLKGLTPNGLMAALLACGGLTKVKLQSTFRSLLPQRLFEHFEARGCVFQWSDKILQVKKVHSFTTPKEIFLVKHFLYLRMVFFLSCRLN